MSKIKERFSNTDWEGIVFPIKLTGITSLTNHYNIPFDSTLEIFRDNDYRLKGVLKGVIDRPDALDYHENGKVKKVGFIDDETLTARDEKGIEYLIKGVHLLGISGGFIKVENSYKFEITCGVILHSIGSNVELNNSPDLICDFFLCSVPEMFWSGRTLRLNTEGFKAKYRKGFDLEYKSDNILQSITRNYANDYDVIRFNDVTIVLQQIPKEILQQENIPQGIDGILIEYRNYTEQIPNKEFKTIVENFVSFIFGTHLQKIGTSYFDEKYNLVSAFSQNAWNRKILKSATHIPIPLRLNTDFSYFGQLINELFPRFYKLHQEVNLSNCLWRLWIGRELALGSNLPILSSGLEVLIDSYLKFHNLVPKYTKQQKEEYAEIISDTIAELETKLNKYEFKDFVINRLKNPFNFGVGEKMKIFFNHLSFNFDKKSIESQALMTRNLMAHGSVKKDEDSLRKTVKLSQAYITLIHRVILCLLDYDGFYIDYSKEDEIYKRMNENM